MQSLWLFLRNDFADVDLNAGLVKLFPNDR